MITEAKAKELMKKFVALRNKIEKGNTKLTGEYKAHQNLCMQQFKYVIDMHADRYRNFCNYEDLVQEGYIALLSAMTNYNPKKGSFFYWAHRYVKTRISRSANTHTAIRFPLAYAKQHQPRKENNLPLIIDTRSAPDKTLEEIEASHIIELATAKLDEFHKSVVNLFFGLDTGGKGSINKVCKKLNISRAECIEALNTALQVLKANIEL